VGFSCKLGVHPNLPYLPYPALFDKDEHFHEFLLTKRTPPLLLLVLPLRRKPKNDRVLNPHPPPPLINAAVISAEVKAMNAQQFSVPFRRTRRELLRELIHKYT
jgi:hypothetical protein